MAFSKAELGFGVAAVALIAAIAFSFADPPTQTGITLNGNVQTCLGGRTSPRTCVIYIGGVKTVVAVAPTRHGPGDAVTLVQMKRTFTGKPYYVVAP